VPDPSDETTLVEVLDAYRRDGWDGDVIVTADGRLRCSACGRDVDPADVILDSLRRLEGASDPDDMVAVLAVTCPGCGGRGTAVVHYGPGATEAETAVLLGLEDRRDGRGGAPV
jgi:hypothetical protein